MRFTSLFVLGALAVPSPALADVVGPADPSVTCPAGALVETNHCGTVCVARRCDSAATCGFGEVCEPVSNCANDEEYCGGGGGLYERIYTDCAAGCAVGECRTYRACVPGTRTDGGVRTDAGGATVVTYGCGCRTARGSSGAGAVFALVLGLWLWRRR